MTDVDLKPLEEILSAKVFNMLKEEGKINDDIIKLDSSLRSELHGVMLNGSEKHLFLRD